MLLRGLTKTVSWGGLGFSVYLALYLLVVLYSWPTLTPHLNQRL
jgi:hypothetical protein